MRVVDDNLESFPWIEQGGTNINPVPALAYIAEQISSGPFAGALKITNISEQALGGALVTCKRPVPSALGIVFCYVGLDMQVYIASDELPNLARLELDAKIVRTSAPTSSTPIENTEDYSGQWNQSNGQWQIDDAQPKWTNSGFSPALVPDTWMPISLRYFYDQSNGKFSVLSINWNGASYAISASLQGIPLLKSNWGAVAALQAQCETLQPGSVTFLLKNIVLTWSDRAF